MASSPTYDSSVLAPRLTSVLAAGANPIKAEESANLPGTSSSHQHSSPQIGKKKRTRTLTTPQQSAVLHALLAQVCTALLSQARSLNIQRFNTTLKEPVPHYSNARRSRTCYWSECP